jgi:hypothetical protein
MQEEHLEDAWAVGKAEVKVSEVVGDKPSCPSAREPERHRNLYTALAGRYAKISSIT